MGGVDYKQPASDIDCVFDVGNESSGFVVILIFVEIVVSG
jgi:hypothetical protein